MCVAATFDAASSESSQPNCYYVTQCDINLLLSEKPQIPSQNEFITCMAKHYGKVEKFGPNSIQRNRTVELTVYTIVTYFYTQNLYLVLLVNQTLTYSCSLLISIHVKTMLLCHSKTSSSKKCLKFPQPQQQLSMPATRWPHRISSVASTFDAVRRIVDPIQKPNPPKAEKISTQPNTTRPIGQPNPWTTV